MSVSTLDRRTALAAMLASAAALPFQAAAAQPRQAGGVRVDVGPLLANSGEPTAGWVAQELPGAIEAALASRGEAGTPVSVRIDYVLLGPNSGGVGPAGGSADQMIGEVTSGGVTHPLRATTTYYPMPQDNVMVEQSNRARVTALARAFADWIARGY